MYARWWGKWNITEKPTLTAGGKAVRKLDGYPDITDEVMLPPLTDTNVWERRVYKKADENNEGLEKYTSEYGEVWVTTPKTASADNKTEYTDEISR